MTLKESKTLFIRLENKYLQEITLKTFKTL